MAKKKRRQSNFSTRKKNCPIKASGIEAVNYKDIELLKMFITEKGKIIPSRISGLSARSQKMIRGAIKRARNASLLSFSEGYVKQDETIA